MLAKIMSDLIMQNVQVESSIQQKYNHYRTLGNRSKSLDRNANSI